MLVVRIDTESSDVIYIVHMVAHKMKQFVYFNSRNLVKSQCMGKYSIINMINKKVLGHITTCLQSNILGWVLRWTSTFRQNGGWAFRRQWALRRRDMAYNLF